MIYPARPKYWCCHFLRTVIRSEEHAEIEAVGLLILNVIVTEEDSLFYRQPAEFTDAVLAKLSRTSVSTLQRQRQRLVKLGYLEWQRGNRGGSSQYYVKLKQTSKPEDLTGQPDRLNETHHISETHKSTQEPTQAPVATSSRGSDNDDHSIDEPVKPKRSKKESTRTEEEHRQFDGLFEAVLTLCGDNRQVVGGRVAKMCWMVVDAKYERPLTGSELLDELPCVLQKNSRGYCVKPSERGGVLVELGIIEKTWPWIRERPTGSLANKAQQFLNQQQQTPQGERDRRAIAAAAAAEQLAGGDPLARREK